MTKYRQSYCSCVFVANFSTELDGNVYCICQSCEVWGSHFGSCDDFCHTGHDTVSSDKIFADGLEDIASFFLRATTSRKQWAEHITRLGYSYLRHGYTVYVGKPRVRKLLGLPGCGSEDIIKMNHRGCFELVQDRVLWRTPVTWRCNFKNNLPDEVL